MGMAATQARLLCYMEHKNDTQLKLSMLANDKTSLARDMQKVTNEYQNEINIFGQFFDGYQTISFAYFSDYEIQAQLKYLCIHIPVYSLIKKGEPDLAKKVFHWIMEM